MNGLRAGGPRGFSGVPTGILIRARPPLRAPLTAQPAVATLDGMPPDTHDDSSRTIRLALLAAAVVLVTVGAAATGALKLFRHKPTHATTDRKSRQWDGDAPPGLPTTRAGDDPTAEDPAVARAKAAIIAHPWWQGKATGATVERLVMMATDHTSGFVLFNPQGEILWMPPSLAGFDRMPADSPHVRAAILGTRGTNEELRRLGDAVRLVFVTPTGPVYTRAEAMAVLLKALDVPEAAPG